MFLRDFYLIENPGNTFLHGPRGSGKSMIFRVMCTDCLKERTQKSIEGLPYYAVLIPIKHSALNISDLEYLENQHGNNLLNEHFLVVYFSIALFNAFANESFSSKYSLDQMISFYNNIFLKYYNRTISLKGIPIKKDEVTTINEVFKRMVGIFDEIQAEFSQYLQKLLLSNEKYNYTGHVCTFRDFLFPVLQEITKLDFFPKEKPLYFLVDDADLLNLTQTKILNSWVSYRSTASICFKLSTQLNYKTFFYS